MHFWVTVWRRDVYVGLRAGLTVGASIPIAVLSISGLRAFGRASILENNIVQTTGNSGQSIASGVIFTLPALIFLGFDLEYSRIFLLALLGGLLGVLFMIPLRRQLIVEEHGRLIYPEGTACADVLLAGERGGSFAGRVFLGLRPGRRLHPVSKRKFVRRVARHSGLPATVAERFSDPCRRHPGIPGCGLHHRSKIAGFLFAGGIFSWLVLMPAIYFFGSHLPGDLSRTEPIARCLPQICGHPTFGPWAPVPSPLRADHADPDHADNRECVRAAMGNLRQTGGVKSAPLRTDDDLPFSVVVGGSVVLVLLIFFFLTFKPVPGAQVSWLANLSASLLVAFFGFLFVTVSSRICGLIGSSSNPVSGMTIATLMATSAIFLVKGWTAPAFGALAITIGGVVCIAAANAGDTSQDLKTGYLIGATPRKQQIALVIGAFVSTLAIGATLQLMNQGLAEFRQTAKPWDMAVAHSGVQVEEQHFHQAQIRVMNAGKLVDTRPGNGYVLLNALNSPELADGKYLYNPQTQQIEIQWIQGIGSEKAAAPQARLMATVVNGILGRKLPWGLVLLGVFLVIAVEILGVRSLSFAVGAYLSDRHHASHLCRWCGAMDDRSRGRENGKRERGQPRIALCQRVDCGRRNRRIDGCGPEAI